MTISSPSGPTKKQLKPLNSLELEATCGGLSLPNEIMGLPAAVPHETSRLHIKDAEPDLWAEAVRIANGSWLSVKKYGFYNGVVVKSDRSTWYVYRSTRSIFVQKIKKMEAQQNGQ